MARKRRLKKTVARKLKVIVCAFFLVLSCILYNNIFRMNILPSKYLKLTLLTLLFMNCFAMLLFQFRKKLTKFFGFLIYVLLFAICTVGIRYSSITINFLHKAFSIKNEIVVYDVITLKDSYSELTDLENKTIGCFDIDTNDYLGKLTDKVSIKTSKYDLYTLYENLLNKEISAIVINASYLTLLEEQYTDMKDKIDTLYTYEIEIKAKKNEEVKELKPVNIYISGIDSRSDKLEAIGLSDVNMIITLNPLTKTILMTGIPRDYYVQLHGTTGPKDKLTHSGAYGIEMGKTTLEDTLGIKIDYTIKLGFGSVVSIVDLVGGIDIESDTEFWSFHYDGWYVQKGMNHMDGEHALAYARERYAYADGDEHRVRNQQQVFEAVFNKIIKNKNILLKYETLLNELSSLYATSIPESYVTLLIKSQIDDMKSWKVIKQSVTGDVIWAECYSLKGQDVIVMEPKVESITEAKKKINEVLGK